jgi:hypothetical protein
MIYNLKRTARIEIIEWIWLLEFHENGYPHYHLVLLPKDDSIKFTEMRKAVRDAWKLGKSHVKRIASEEHLDNLISYLGGSKRKPRHQTNLPEWALPLRSSIRRYNRKARKLPTIPDSYPDDERGYKHGIMKKILWGLKHKETGFDNSRDKDRNFSGKKKVTRRTNQEILQDCGQRSQILETDVYTGKRDHYHISVPYGEVITKWADGVYVKRLGYEFEADDDEWENYVKDSLG